jgi:hypothetical protein
MCSKRRSRYHTERIWDVVPVLGIEHLQSLGQDRFDAKYTGRGEFSCYLLDQGIQLSRDGVIQAEVPSSMVVVVDVFGYQCVELQSVLRRIEGDLFLFESS